MSDPMGEPPAGWDEVPEHPGVQCHEAHPDRPHRRAAALPVDYGSLVESPPERVRIDGRPVAQPTPPAPLEATAAQVDTATALVLLGSDPWSRFDLWAQRAWGLLERATAEGATTEDTTTLLEGARVCADLARECSPLSALAGLPGRLPELELTIPDLG